MSSTSNLISSNFEKFEQNAIATIFEYVDPKGHENLANVCKIFYEIVNSGIVEGKNAREYLLTRLDVTYIDFDITYSDMGNILKKRLLDPSHPSSKPQIPVPIRDMYIHDMVEALYRSRDFNDEFLMKIRDLMKKNIKMVIKEIKGLSNINLINYIKNQNSQEEKSFIKNIVVESLAFGGSDIYLQEEFVEITTNLRPSSEEAIKIFKKYEDFFN